jgi:hypothetical protein
MKVFAFLMCFLLGFGFEGFCFQSVQKPAVGQLKGGAPGSAKIILDRRAATCVSPVRLHSDSSFSSATNVNFLEGSLFEVLGETGVLHDDNNQTQLFKWYKVRSLQGQEGWLYGDNLAVVVPSAFVDFVLKPFYKKEAHFDNGFENSIIWVASVAGKDNMHSQNSLNQGYKDFYLVVTNEFGKSVVIPYSGISETGRKELKSIYIKDINDNKVDEIVLEISSVTTGSGLENRNVEIYTFQASGIQKIFEERTTLVYDRETPSPALFKVIEIDKSIIRVAYIDYVGYEQYSLGLPFDPRTKTQEKCLEFVTYSLIWDNVRRQYKVLYKENRTAPQGFVSEPTLLKYSPSSSSNSGSVYVQTNQKFQIIKHYENISFDGYGQKVVENSFFVKHPSGVYGYLPANVVLFKGVEHGSILKSYYKHPPLNKSDWKWEGSFIVIK